MRNTINYTLEQTEWEAYILRSPLIFYFSPVMIGFVHLSLITSYSETPEGGGSQDMTEENNGK